MTGRPFGPGGRASFFFFCWRPSQTSETARRAAAQTIVDIPESSHGSTAARAQNNRVVLLKGRGGEGEGRGETGELEEATRAREGGYMQRGGGSDKL